MPEFSSTAWLVIGLGLIIAEIFSLSLVLLFFGMAALLVAVAKWFGLADIRVELVLFGVLGILGMLIFRRRIKSTMHASKGADIDQQTTLTLSAQVPANGEASVQYQGSSWTAVNRGAEPLVTGTVVRIIATEGIKLVVERA